MEKHARANGLRLVRRVGISLRSHGDARVIMRFNDVRSPSSEARYDSEDPTDSNHHNPLDGGGSVPIAVCCVDGAQPRTTCLGGDSAIELLSAVVVLWRFRAPAQERSEKHVARIAAALLFILAAYVAVISAMTLLGHREAKTTYSGIAVLIGAAAIMPWLVREKRRLSAITGQDLPREPRL